MNLRELTNPTAPRFPTLALFGSLVLVEVAVWALVVGGDLSPWVGSLVLTPVAYAIFTPLHEACHKNIQGGGRLGGVEALVGHLSALVLLAPYPLFRVQHLRHHSFVNDPEKDPDYWVHGTPGVALLLRALTILPAHYVHFLRNPTRRGWELVPQTVVANLGMLGLDWFPHHPHESTGRWDNATIYTAPALDTLLLYQNYHLIHHLYPGIPFYRYKEAFGVLKEQLEEHGAPVILGAWPASQGTSPRL